MSASRRFKRLVRERMAQSGLKYCAAREQILQRSGSGPLVVAVVGLKGGIGRTTLALAIGAELANRGKRVAIAEIVEPGYEPEDCFGRYCEEAFRRSGFPAPSFIEVTCNELAHGGIRRLHRRFDVILLDPFRAVDQQFAALMVADLGIVPANQDAYGSIGRLLDLLPFLRKQRTVPDNFTRAVILRDPRLARYREEAVEATVAEAGLPVLNARIDLREAYGWFGGRGLPLSAITDSPSAVKAAGDIGDLVDELFPPSLSTVSWKTSSKVTAFLPLAPRFHPLSLGSERLRQVYFGLMSRRRR